MKIKIVYLYYDLMNLYGESGNVKSLKQEFKKQGIHTEIYFFSVDDKFNFEDYDIFYIGMGSEKSKFIVLKDLIKRKQYIKSAIENNKYFFLTGNAYELFGKYILCNNKKIKTLNIFQFYTKTEENIKLKITGSIIGICNLIENKIIGNQNRNSFIYNNNSPFIYLIKGTGNIPLDIKEGYVYKNFYATCTIGPFFIRNPYLLKYFINKIINEMNEEYKLKIYNNTPEILAYNNYLDLFDIDSQLF